MPGRKVMRGFTIVELLIVISVITILAAIVIVSYNSVQNNSRDAAVQSDLRGIGDKAEEFRLGSGTYPSATQTDLQSIIKVAKNAYIVNSSSSAMSYCRSDTDFTVLGRSASGNTFIYSSKMGLKAVTYAPLVNNQCALGGVTSTDSGFSSILLLKGTGDAGGYGWQSWIN